MATFIRALGTRLRSPFVQLSLGSTALGVVGSFQYQPKVEDFFHQTFITRKDPDAVVDFYSTEDFLQILGVFPLAIHFVLAGVDWDTKRENTMDVWGSMQISFDITEKEETIDGEDVVTFFNKRERFVNYIPLTKILLWDQVQDYGFRRLPDGSMEISHHGESFYGPWPIRFLIAAHARYVLWATEKHINSPLFGTKDLEAQEHQRSNIPLHVAKEWLATLQASQESAVSKKKAKLGSKATEAQAGTLTALKRLARHDTVLSIERKADGTVKVHADDPKARAAIKAALTDIKAIEGKDAAGKALSALLDKPEVETMRGQLRRSSSKLA